MEQGLDKYLSDMREKGLLFIKNELIRREQNKEKIINESIEFLKGKIKGNNNGQQCNKCGKYEAPECSLSLEEQKQGWRFIYINFLCAECKKQKTIDDLLKKIENMENQLSDIKAEITKEFSYIHQKLEFMDECLNAILFDNKEHYITNK